MNALRGLRVNKLSNVLRRVFEKLGVDSEKMYTIG